MRSRMHYHAAVDDDGQGAGAAAAGAASYMERGSNVLRAHNNSVAALLVKKVFKAAVNNGLGLFKVLFSI